MCVYVCLVCTQDLEIKRLTKSLETSRAAELAAELRWEEAEGATAKAKEETLTHKQQIAQVRAHTHTHTHTRT